MRKLSYRNALREAQAQALAADPSVFVMGLGVDDRGGVFGSTLNLHKEFGADRVFDLPLAENGLTGVAIGAALAGCRPVLVHQRVDFLLLTMDQLVNHAAKWHYMFGGRQSVPLVVRAVVGRGWGQGAQHSQSFQALFMHCPGMKVVLPSNAYDAKGLLLASIADPNPVVFIEHRSLYDSETEVPEESYEVPIGQAAVRRGGGDVTIVAVSYMANEALRAADELARRGVDAEVIDLRSVLPWDQAAVLRSVDKTGALVVADTGWKTAGAGAEIAAFVTEHAFGRLRAAPRRVALPDVPTPTTWALERIYYPGADAIVAAAEAALGVSGDAAGKAAEDAGLRQFVGPF